MKPSALEEAKSRIVGLLQLLGGGSPKVVSPLPDGFQPTTKPNYAALITDAYQKLGGATPDLMAQIPVMAKQIEQNPSLYPVYPAIPYAETSLGKNVTHPGNYFNWGTRVQPYPLQDYSPQYITSRVAYRLSTNPAYEQFRKNPSPQTLQASGYAPVGDNNPHWLPNMEAAVKAFLPAK
jgi:hypothetical protein